jgi:glycosyltransferase involved in cell wall biosynthesis
MRSVTYNLVQGLRQWTDLEIHVVHCHSEVDRDRDECDGNVTLHYRAMPRARVIPNSLLALPRVERLLRELRPDVVNAHAPHYALAALRAGCRTILTIHGVLQREAEIYTSTLFDRTRFGLETWLEQQALRHVSDIVAISPYVLDEYQSRTRARFHRIDNPLPPDYYNVPNLELPLQLLYVGTIDERKNVLDLLRALLLVRQTWPQVTLRVAGRSTSPAYERQVQAFVAAQGLQPNVEFLGLQDHPHLLDEYAHCAVVVLASRQETAPMALIEAMAAGKPVVATRVGGVAELVEDGSSGFVVPPGDVEALALRIQDLLGRADLRHSMGQRARQLSERFRLETVAAAYRRLYYEVAGRNVL